MILRIDGSNFYHRLLYKNPVKSPNDIDTFINVMLGSLRKLCNQFQPQGIVVCKDSKPTWRHNYNYKANVMESVINMTNDKGYKGTRVKEEEAYDWASVEKAYNGFLNLIQDTFSIDVVQIYKAEADDIIAYMAAEFTRQGLFTVSITADGDDNQTLNSKVVRFDPTRGVLYLHSALQPVVEHIQKGKSVNGYYNLEYIINRMFYGKPVVKNIVYVTPWAYMLEKIICGDDGDNIHPVVMWETMTKNGKLARRKITPKPVARFVDWISMVWNTKDFGKLGMKSLYDEGFLEHVYEFILREDKRHELVYPMRYVDNEQKKKHRRGYSRDLDESCYWSVYVGGNPCVIRTKPKHDDVMGNFIVVEFRNQNRSIKVRGGCPEWDVNDRVTDYNLYESLYLQKVKKAFENNRKMVLINKHELPDEVISMLQGIDLRYPQERFNYQKAKLERFSNYVQLDIKAPVDEEEIEITEEDEDGLADFFG